MSQKGITITLPRSVTDNNYGDSTKSKKELSHMWDERRLIKNPLG
jgi:hypothetical protein